jgi:hypothetical protein
LSPKGNPMTTQSWLRHLKWYTEHSSTGTSSRASRKKPRNAKLLLEPLESRLAPASVAITATSLNDSGFEMPVLGNGQYQYSPTGAPWTFSPRGASFGAGITGNNSGFTQYNPSAPEGSQVGFLQGQSSISQNVTFLAGTYNLSFYAAQRAVLQDSRQTFQVLVDGNVVGTFNDLMATAYTHLVTGKFTVTPGSHAVTFQGTDIIGGNNTVFLDQGVLSTNGDVGTAYTQTISATGGSGSYAFNKTSGTLPTGLVLTNDGVLSGTPTAVGSFSFTVTVTDSLNNSATQLYNMTINPPVMITATSLNDSGFESPVLGNGQYEYVPAGTPWTFSQIGAFGSGITGNNSGFTQANPNAPEGNQVAFLQNMRDISQSMAFLAGTYNISFYAAQRGIYQDSSQTFQILIDGNVVGTFNNLTGTTYTPLATGNFTVTAGSHTLTFQATDLHGGDNTVFLDQASINLLASLNDPGFETPAAGSGKFLTDPSTSPWLFTGSAGLAGNNSPFTSGNPAAPQGAQVAFLQGMGSLSQVTNIPAGSYTVSFFAAQRGNAQASSQTFQVLVDGNVVGTFNNLAGAAYGALTTGSFTVAAGSHTLTFQATDVHGGDNTVFIDQVTIQSPIVSELME